MIEVKNLYKSFGQKPILKDVNIQINKNEIDHIRSYVYLFSFDILPEFFKFTHNGVYKGLIKKASFK